MGFREIAYYQCLLLRSSVEETANRPLCGGDQPSLDFALHVAAWVTSRPPMCSSAAIACPMVDTATTFRVGPA